MKLFTAQHLGQKQSLVITAQLQQAIHLLRMTNTELADYIEEQSQENPFLELGHVTREGRAEGNLQTERVSRDRSGPDFSSRKSGGSDDFDLIATMVATPKPSLYAHVTSAIETMFDKAEDKVVAGVFLDALEPTGWLGESLDLIAQKARVEISKAEAVLYRLQEIEPAGLFARNLSECLTLQARDAEVLNPQMHALLQNLPKLAAGDLKELARICNCTFDELRDLMSQLRSFNPKPGSEFDAADAPIRAPDLIVKEGPEGGWMVELNRSNLAAVIIREDDAKSVAKGKGDAAKYVNEKLAQARYLERAVQHRNTTTLRVGAEVMRRQQAFLAHGPSHIAPMILREVADELNVHESTVSRVTAGLLIATPIGTFPLKMFFSASLPATAANPEQAGSAASVRHKIKKIVDSEPADAPYSDDAIAQMVSEGGVLLARRTVAKYRDMLNIPSSFQRRRQNMLKGLVG